MKRRFSLYCPECEELIVEKIDKIQSHKNNESSFLCPNCKINVRLMKTNICCPLCKKKSMVSIPRGYQILDICRISYPCPNCNKEKVKTKRKDFWNYIEQYDNEKPPIQPTTIEWTCEKGNHRFLLLIIPGIRSTCLLYSDVCPENEDIIPNPLTSIVHKAGIKFTEFFQWLGIPKCNRFLSIWEIRGLSEIFFCFLLGMFLGFILPILLFGSFGLIDEISRVYRLITGLIWSAALYFLNITMKEIAVVLGKLELSIKKPMNRRMFHVFFINSPYVFFIIFLIEFIAVCSDDIEVTFDIFNNNFGLYSDLWSETGKIRWIDNFSAGIAVSILYGLLAPILLGFGMLLYYLWEMNNTRQKIPTIKIKFVDITPQVERIGEIAIYIILFNASVIFIHEYIFQVLTSPLLVSFQNSFFNNMVYRPLLIGIALLAPLLWYFLFLGKITSDLRAVELQRIEKVIEELDIKQDIDKWKVISNYRKEVQQAFRWIRVIEVGSRVILLLFVFVQTIVLYYKNMIC